MAGAPSPIATPVADRHSQFQSARSSAFADALANDVLRIGAGEEMSRLESLGISQRFRGLDPERTLREVRCPTTGLDTSS
jgi:hypothetical protein